MSESSSSGNKGPGAGTIDLSQYEDLYKHFHRHPELSKQEEKTSQKVASLLKEFGYEVHDKIGGFGVVGVLSNGSGPKVLLRADMDGLPVKEQTGLDYASQDTARDADDLLQPVAHACGHDMHITCLLAAAEVLIKTKSTWSGTIIAVFQPAEEKGSGAQAMVDDGLYKKVPVPDVVLGQHVAPFKAGTVGLKSGPTLAAADSTKVTFFGRGGHASSPHATIDPIVMAAAAVLRMQTVVSREINTDQDMAVLTVGSLHAGQTENVIPALAEMKTNVRAYDNTTRDRIVGSMKRIVRAESQASGAEKEPAFEQISRFPVTVNDSTEYQKIADAFERRFGDCCNRSMQRHPASEDVGNLATSVNKPLVFWMFGGVDPDTWEKAVKEGTVNNLPVNHSPFYAPVIKPTLQTGIDTLCTAAMAYVGKPTKAT